MIFLTKFASISDFCYVFVPLKSSTRMRAPSGVFPSGLDAIVSEDFVAYYSHALYQCVHRQYHHYATWRHVQNFSFRC
jgi:hypothetical protein